MVMGDFEKECLIYVLDRGVYDVYGKLVSCEVFSFILLWFEDLLRN